MERKVNASAKSKPSAKILWLGAIIGAVIGIIAFAPIWLQYNGQYIELGDGYEQFIPFVKELKRMLASGSLAWSWNSFLGDGLVGAYSYYTIFNPFAWIVALFPSDCVLYGAMFVTILKFAVSMVAAILYFRCFCKRDSYALIGALLYTFSGFTLINTKFYFFLDAAAVFPFVMYGLEKLICERKKIAYVLSLALSVAINYYFFVATALLMAIYVVFRLELYKISAWKIQWKMVCSLAVYSLLGIGLAGIALAPAFYAILGSGKATESIGTSIELVYTRPQIILERLRTLVAPIESARHCAFYNVVPWTSTGVYLPVFGCFFVVQWCLRKKDWLKKVCIALVACYFVPVLNSAFNLFSSTLYTRWLYGMALIFSLVTVISLEEMENEKQKISKKLLIWFTLFAAGLLLMPTVIYILCYFGIPIANLFANAVETSLFMGYSAIAIMLILTALNYIALWFIVGGKKRTVKLTFIIVAAACLLNYWVFNQINVDLQILGYSREYYYEKTWAEGKESTDENFEYRIDYPEQVINYGLFKNLPTVNYFNSLQNPGSSRFAQAVGIGENMKDTILQTPKVGGEYTNALLSVKYYYDYDGNSVIPAGFRYLKTENKVDIYENENYIPMGFTYDSYCLEESLEDMLPEERAKLMLHTMVVKSEYEEVAKRYLPLETNLTPGFELNQLASKRRETTCSYFKGTSKGFDAKINLEEDNIVFFSTPNDSGWEITVNGEPAEVVEVNYGLLGVCCKAGENTISATYHTKGWTLGVICSLVALAAWLLIEMLSKRKSIKEMQ